MLFLRPVRALTSRWQGRLTLLRFWPNISCETFFAAGLMASDSVALLEDIETEITGGVLVLRDNLFRLCQAVCLDETSR